MDINYLRNLSFNSLKKIGEDMGLSIPQNNNELIDNILVCFKQYEDYKKEKLDKYKKIERIGNKGKALEKPGLF